MKLTKTIWTKLFAIGLGATMALGVGLTATNLAGAKEVSATPSLLNSFNFLDGGSNNNNGYANTNLATNISYAVDNPGGAGTTAWEADYANLSLTAGTRLGGKLVSAVQTDDTTAWANIKTKFAFGPIIEQVEVLGVATFGTAENVTALYLQSSTSGTTWTTQATTTSKTGTISFSGLSIPASSYLRFGIALTASSTNSGIAFTGMKVYESVGSVVSVTGVTVSPSSHTMAASETHLPTATVAPANATNQTVSWESDDPDVASVDPVTGLVTGVSEGTATVTATTEDGGFMDTIDYTITAGPFYTHQFASGEFGDNTTYVDIRGAQVTLDSINWSLSASYYPDWTDQNAYLGFIANRGLQVGSGDKAPYEFGLRSALTSHKVIKVIVKAGAASSIIDGYLSVSVGGVDLGSPQALSTSTVTPEVTFQSETPLFGHIQITYTQSNDGTVAGSKAFYIDKVTIYGETDANISSASAFANDLESFDSCGVGSEYSSLESGYEALSSTAKGHLSSILLDDKNNVGQTAGTTIQRDVISASDKWNYVTIKFGGDYGSQETLIDSSKSILSIVAISIIGLSTILGYRFISKKKEA